MKISKSIRIAAAFLLVGLCAAPMFAQRGSADFTRFVALGDSYGAGFQSGGLTERHQEWSWPAVVARQAGLEFCQASATAAADCWAFPRITYPGIPAELVLGGLTVGPVSQSGQGTPTMTTFARPYNNLAVPGATVGALLTLTGAEPPSAGEPTAVTFSRFILRGQGTQVQQAVALQPTFIAMWIGGNDYLGAALAGTPAALTSVADFKTRYEAVLNSLTTGAPNAGMVVGNLPNVIPPYFTLVPPYLVNPATGQPVLDQAGNRIYYVADLGGGTFGQIPATSYITLDARAQLAQGYGIPAVFKTIPPFSSLPHVGEPLADRYVLTPTEVSAITARVAEYNTIISQAAAAKNIPVADVAGLFNRVATGLHIGPFTITGQFVQGGFFSLDGFHLTDLGYLLMGDEFIKAINDAYGSRIPVASITQLYADNGALFPDSSTFGVTADNVVFGDGVAEQIRQSWATQVATAPAGNRRFRAVGH
ncbi:MAG TPA: SGNH/GDSL hydrolase family protein [Thermoanaerobaculia bacterium]|nr:SGNH/GDSL hydrolase family protein [Thermoanaerobaculia bacterium]